MKPVPGVRDLTAASACCFPFSFCQEREEGLCLGAEATGEAKPPREGGVSGSARSTCSPRLRGLGAHAPLVKLWNIPRRSSISQKIHQNFIRLVKAANIKQKLGTVEI